MIAAGRGPSDRASFIQRGESERAVWCLPGGADLPWCAAAGAQLPGHWIRFGASLPHDRRRERPVGPGHVVPPGGADLPRCAAAGAQLPGHWIRFGPLCRMIGAGRGPSDRASFIQRGESERAVWCLPGGADLPWCAAAGAQLPGHWSRFGPLCRMIAAGRGPSDRASFIQRGESERAVWCLPGGADLPWCAAAGAQLPGHWSRFGPLCRMIAAGRGPSDRAVWCLPGGADLPWCAAAGAQLPGHWSRFGPLCRMIAAGRGPSDRAVWCLPGGADLPWCAAAGAQLPGHWIRFGASLPHDRRRERPVGPGRVVPPGGADLPWCAAAGAQLPGHWSRFGPLCRMIAAGRGPSDRASFIQRGESERAVWCLPGGADLPWCAAAGAQLPGHWSRFGPLCRMIAAGRGPSDRANFIQRGESERAVWCLPGGADLPWCAAAGAQLPGHWIRFGPLCRMIGAGRGPSDRASFIQRGESERAVWCLPGGADLPWCAAAGAQLPGHWSRFGPLCRMIAAGRGPSDRAVWCLPGGADLPWCAAAGAQLPGHWSRFGPLCRMVGAGRGPSDRASFIQRGESERAVWCLPGGADLPWCAAAGAQLPGHWIRFGPLCRMVGAGRGPSDRASFIQRGESERAVWCLPGGADLPWCAAAGAQLPGHWIRFGASLPHDRRRERPVGPGQFHSERRIRAGRVVPPGRCGFAMVRRSGGATARPLESIWSLSAA